MPIGELAGVSAPTSSRQGLLVVGHSGSFYKYELRYRSTHTPPTPPPPSSPPPSLSLGRTSVATWAASCIRLQTNRTHPSSFDDEKLAHDWLLQVLSLSGVLVVGPWCLCCLDDVAVAYHTANHQLLPESLVRTGSNKTLTTGTQ